MKNVLKPLAKNVLIPLVLTVAASITDAAIHKKKFGVGMTTVIISNEEINDIMKMCHLKNSAKTAALKLVSGSFVFAMN